MVEAAERMESLAVLHPFPAQARITQSAQTEGSPDRLAHLVALRVL